MKTTCEAMIHKAVVSPVVIMAGLIDVLAGLARFALSVVDRVAGNRPRRRSGFDDVNTA